MYDWVKDLLLPVVSILVSAVVAYATAVYALRRELGQGRLRLLELVRRYFLNVLNAFDPATKQINQDALSKQYYVEELKAILAELTSLVAHPYFCALVIRYPLTSKLLVQCRREIIEHGAQQSFAINVGTMTEFWRLHQILCKDMPKVGTSDLDKAAAELASALQLRGIEQDA